MTQTSRRLRELCAAGLDPIHAGGVAFLEETVRQWPTAWGDNLELLIYGDFEPPQEDLHIPSLGITVYREKLEHTWIRTAGCVLKATVKVKDKTVAALTEALKRINVLLGAFTLVDWGNCGSGWWSRLTHGAGGAGGRPLNRSGLALAIDGILKLKKEVRQEVAAALFWIREPRKLLREFYRTDVLRMYSAYWNAFECLVEAVNLLQSRPKLTRTQKQSFIDDLMKRKGGRLTPGDIQDCYRKVVDPGFVAKASHALRVCFGSDAEHYIRESFTLPEKRNRLYQVRNAINHGAIDAEHPEELIRIEARLERLWMIVWRMFGCLLPFPAPLNSQLAKSKT